MADLSAHHGSKASADRLKKRKAAQWRLQAYGIAAIFLAGLALATLLSTVLKQASGALSESYVSLEVPLPPEEVDPEGTGDPTEIGRADFGGLVKDALKERFPSATSRSDRRELYDIVSSGATFELRDRVMSDPSLIGGTEPFTLLASDVTDLYMKGDFGRLQSQPHAGTLGIIRTEEEDTVMVSSSANDFAQALGTVKGELLEQAAFQRRQAGLQERGVEAFESRAASATDADQKAQLEAEAVSRATERDRLLAIAEDLERRASEAGGTEALADSAPSILLKVGTGWIKLTELNTQGGIGNIVVPIGDTEEFAPDDWGYYIHELPENARKVSDKQVVWIETLRNAGELETVFNTRFFTSGDSREPELAGIWGAAVGTFWTMLVTFALAFPIGVLAAIYLEEFAPKNKLTDFIEVNINNLAAVPSIVFGLLGLAVFLNFFGVPRSSPLAGGIVLALMTLPTIIIASRASIRAVPPSIRDAALGLGASRLQTSFHHVFPLAMPGILTGTIIGMAQALGETAPLIMIGMVAFIVDIPTGITDSATVLPVQVFRWSDFPERAFEARTGAAICVLLLFLVVMNALAVFLRKRFERRW
ncbi:phosphate ABC transporter permease PstA [Algicella marina]|uniref:Phosphate transport system permease protein PstA n=1 Tax=Algicella marina TaxID=2683284 RepID=A0A6P1T6Q8_9RHOB|nr:phosphate ABC transporter permease PstA [Algicella marina]